MKKKATARPANATSRQSTLNFPTSSEADVVAESAAAATLTKPGVKNRRKGTADFADDADNRNTAGCNSSVIYAKSAVKNDSLYEDSTSLPDGWRWIKFGDVCKVQGGFAFKSKDYTKNGVPLVRISNLVNESVRFESDTAHLPLEALKKHPEFVLKNGDVLIAMSGATTGKMATFSLDTQALLNQRVGRFRLLPGAQVEPRFLRLMVQQLTRRVLKEAYGAAQPNISPSQIEQFVILLPPLPEQHRIVAEIEKQFTRLDAGVAALKRVQANLKCYRVAVLKAACEGKLVPTEAELRRTADYADKKMRPSASSAKSAVKTPPFETGEQLLQRILNERRQNWQGRGQYKEPESPDLATLPTLPAGWTWANVAQLSFLDVGFAFKSAEFTKSGVRLLRGDNLEPGRMRWTDTRFWPESKLDEFRHLLILEGEIVLAMDRPLISSGLKIARARADDLPCLLVQRMARFRPIVREMTSFLFTTLNTFAFIRHLLGGQTGTQLPHINGEGIQSFPIPLPPLAEQTRIVAEVERRLSVVDEVEAVVSANLQRANRLRQSILQKAFTGKLTGADTCDHG